jgi:hypothetical protein
MAEKSVPDMIFDKFADFITADSLFKEISNDLVLAVRQKHGKDKIEELLRKAHNENPKP